MALSSSSNTVALITIGYGRKNAVEYMPNVFNGTRYLMTAAFDLVETMEPYRLTRHNLAVALHNLHPRPLALVVGIAVHPSYMPEIEDAWNEYVDNVLKIEYKDDENWKRNCLVPLSLTHWVDPSAGKPPMNMGWQEEMFRQLNAVFEAELIGK